MKIVLKLEMTITVDVIDDEQTLSKTEDLQTVAQCEHCAWRGIYSTPVRAKRAQAAHMRFCKGSGSTVKQAFDRLIQQ